MLHQDIKCITILLSREDPIKGEQVITVMTGEQKDLKIKGLDFNLAAAASAKATGKILEQSQLANRVSVSLNVTGATKNEKEAWKDSFDCVIDSTSKDDKRLKFMFSTMQNEEEFRKALQRSGLCLLPLRKESTLFGVEALMAGYVGIPLLVARNSGVANLLYSVFGHDSVIEIRGAVGKDVEIWKDHIVRKILNSKETEEHASEIRNSLLKETSIEASHQKFICAILEKSCAGLSIAFDDGATISDMTKLTAQKLNVCVDGNNNTSSEAELYITAFTQYFLHQHSKISLGLFDNILPAEIKDAWDELIALLEKRSRKLLAVNKGSILFKLYCPTSSSVDDLKELVETGLVNKAFAMFHLTLGISVRVSQATLSHNPLFTIGSLYNEVSVVRPMFERVTAREKTEVSSGIGSEEPLLMSDSASIVPEDNTLLWLEHNIPTITTPVDGNMKIIDAKLKQSVRLLLGQNSFVVNFGISRTNKVAYSFQNIISEKKIMYTLSAKFADSRVFEETKDIWWKVAYITFNGTEFLLSSKGRKLVASNIVTNYGNSVVYVMDNVWAVASNDAICFCSIDEKSVACAHLLQHEHRDSTYHVLKEVCICK